MTDSTPGFIVPHDLEARRALLCFATAAAVESYGQGAWRALDFGSADLSILRTGRAPLLADHARCIESVLGVVESAWLDEDRAVAVVRFAATPRALEAWGLVRDRIIGNVSMGFTHSAEGQAEDGTEDAPVPIRNWRPFEVSLVVVPANWHSAALPGAPAPNLHAVAAAAEDHRRDELRLAIEAARRAEQIAWAAGVAPRVAASLGTDPARTAQALTDALSEAA